MKEVRAQRRAESEVRQTANRERREREKRVAALETEIAALEARQSELVAQLEKPETYDNPSLAMEINRRLAGVAEALEKANAEWLACPHED